MEPIIIVFLLIALGMITVVGHGVWLALGWLFRGGRSRYEVRHLEPTVPEDRAATSRYLNYLRSHDFIDADTQSRLLKAMAEEARGGKRVPAHLGKLQAPVSTQAPRHADVPRSATKEAPLAPGTLTAKPGTAFPPVSAGHDRGVAAPSGGMTSGPGAPTTFTPRIPLPDVPIPKPPEPRRPLAEVLAGFMADKNIRWGELVGGLLILCCSTALVISLWSQIQAIPVLKFVIFTGVTAALFGVGLFVHHRWRLPTTGHAVLIVSSLLVPLNMLAFAAFSRERAAAGWTIGIEAATVLVFGFLTLLAARVLIPGMPKLFALGVVLLSGYSLLIRVLAPESSAGLVVCCLPPLLLYLAVIGAALWQNSKATPLSEAEAKRLFLHLGAQTFACLAPLGFAVYTWGQIISGLHLLSPLVCALAAALLVTGVFVWRRLTEKAPPQLRIASLSVALIAAVLLLAGAVLAWPRPAELMPVVLVNAAAIGLLAWLTGYPGFHAGVAACLGLAWVLGVHLVTGRVSWSTADSASLRTALASALTGQALIAPSLLCLGAADWLRRRGRRALAVGYGSAAAAFAVVSLFLVTCFGFAAVDDPQHVTWVYLVYGAAAFLVAWRLHSPLAVSAGCMLAQLGLIQALVYVVHLQDFPWQTAILAGAAAAALMAIVLRVSERQAAAEVYFVPLAEFAIIAASMAAVWMLISPAPLLALSVRMAVITIVLGALAIVNVWPLVFVGSQLAAIVTACVATQHWIGRHEWYAAGSAPLAEPWVWQAHLLVIAGLCLLWAALRRGVDRPAGSLESLQASPSTEPKPNGRPAARALLKPVFPATDRWLTSLLLLGLVALSIWSVWPAVVEEHGFRPTLVATPQHIHAAGAGSWALLGTLLIILLFHLSEGFRRSGLAGILVALACGTVLLAARFESRHLVVSALRWAGATGFVVSSAAFWTRDYWTAGAMNLLRCRSSKEPVSAAAVRPWLFLLFAVPATVLAFSTISAMPSAAGATATAAFWLRFSLLGPTALIALGLLGYGISERRAEYAVAAAVLTCAIMTAAECCLIPGAVTIEFVIRLVQLNAMVVAGVALVWRGVQMLSGAAHQLPNHPRWPLLLARLAVCAVLLISMVSLWIRPDVVSSTVLAAGTLLGIIAFVLVEFGLLVVQRGRLEKGAAVTQTVWVLFGIILLSCALAPLDTGNWLCFHVLLVALAGGGCLRLLTGSSVLRRLVGGGWVESLETAAAQAGGSPERLGHDVSCTKCGYDLRGLSSTGRCPECGAPIGDALASALNRLTPQWTGRLRSLRLQTTGAVLTFIGLSTAFALRAAIDDPQRPWWSAAVLAGLAGLSLAVAAWGPRRPLAYLGGVEICLAATVWWITLYWLPPLGRFADRLGTVVDANVIALAVAAAAWLLIERRFVRGRSAPLIGAGPLPFHHAAAALTSAAVVYTAGTALLAAIDHPLTDGAAAPWLAWAAAVGLMLACRLDPNWGYTVPGLYTLGLVGVIRGVLQAGSSSGQLAWAVSLAFAGYVLFTAIVWRMWGRTRGDRAAFTPTPQPWLMLINAGLATVSLVLAAHVSTTAPGFGTRLLIGLAPLFCAGAAMLLAVGTERAAMQTCMLALVAMAALLFSCAWVPPDCAGAMLDRAVRFLGVAAATTIVSAAVRVRVRPESTWAASLRWYFAGCNVLAGAALVYVAGSEAWSLVEHRAVSLSAGAGVAMTLSLVAGIVCYLLFATVERWDPLRLPADKRHVYVYMAEALIGILASHIRATMPWLFSGVISQYWPILVLGIAFGLLTAAEVCERRGPRVLAGPFFKTGALLPVVTVLDLLLGVSRVHFSIVLLIMGALYALVAAVRRSLKFAVISGAALNGSLWYLLYETPGLGIAHHPQLWFIPPALAVLLAGHLNRNRLNEKQQRALHYGCMLAIYLSSTADIFLIGVAKAPWLPLVLTGLSVAGVLVGVAARLRSFLFAGTGFLCLSLVTMIWHAATDLGWTWLWYVAGIVLGMAMLIVFALFEKKRREMTAWLDQLKSWSP